MNWFKIDIPYMIFEDTWGDCLVVVQDIRVNFFKDSESYNITGKLLNSQEFSMNSITFNKFKNNNDYFDYLNKKFKIQFSLMNALALNNIDNMLAWSTPQDFIWALQNLESFL